MIAAGLVIVIFGVPLLCWLAVQAARDMDARGQPGWVFGLLVLTFFPFGILAWLAARAKHPLPDG